MRRDWFRQALSGLKISPCIPRRSNRKAPITYDTKTYKQRNLVERMFGRLKDWRRIATRHDRCAHTFMSAICIAPTVIFCLPALSPAAKRANPKAAIPAGSPLRGTSFHSLDQDARPLSHP